VGETATFNVSASGGATPYHYQWQVWMGKEKGWVDLKDAVLPTLQVDNVTMAMSGRKARCIVSDSSGQQIVSDAATLTVIDPHPVDTGDHSNLPPIRPWPLRRWRCSGCCGAGQGRSEANTDLSGK